MPGSHRADERATPQGPQSRIACERDHAEQLRAKLGPGSQPAYDAANEQFFCSGTVPSDYLLTAFEYARARKRVEAIETADQDARADERRAIFEMLGGDYGRALDPPTRQEIADHVTRLEDLARTPGEPRTPESLRGLSEQELGDRPELTEDEIDAALRAGRDERLREEAAVSTAPWDDEPSETCPACHVMSEHAEGCELAPREAQEPTLHEVTTTVCSLCLDGAGGKCVPGCVFWGHELARTLVGGVGSWRRPVGSREAAYDDLLSEKIAEVLAIAESAGIPLFVCASLDGTMACTSLVGVDDLAFEPKLRDMLYIARASYQAIGPIAGTLLQGALDRLGERALASYNARCVEGGGVLR